MTYLMPAFGELKKDCLSRGADLSRTFVQACGTTEFDPGCVKTRTGPISTNYLYRFKPVRRGIHGVGGLARYKVAQTRDTSAFLHNQDPLRTFVICRSELEKMLHWSSGR